METNILYLGDCLAILKPIPDDSVDSIVTDPPYGLEFMGQEWDKFKNAKSWDNRGGQYKDIGDGLNNRISKMPRFDFEPSAFQEFCFDWAVEVFRVLKPGGHLLAFGGTRTYHRLVCAIEDAGFEIRDMVEWIYGSGFPKSLDIGKAIDKKMGVEREIVGIDKNPERFKEWKETDGCERKEFNDKITKGFSQYEGWGTALKPAHEPIVLARKPISEATVAENVLKHGTGGMNIDECRIETDEDMSIDRGEREGRPLDTRHQGWGFKEVNRGNEGRYPANLIHDGSDEVLELFPDTGIPHKERVAIKQGCKGALGHFGGSTPDYPGRWPEDKGGSAARFFYCAKAYKGERDKGCEEIEEQESSPFGSAGYGNQNPPAKLHNFHPTVKPVKLMEYLIKLITPPEGIVLDPFAGSGSTLVAAKRLGFKYIGIEISPEYYKIALKRVERARQRSKGLFV